MVIVQRLCKSRQPSPRSIQLEDAPNNRGFTWIDTPLHMRSLRLSVCAYIIGHDRDIVIPVYLAAECVTAFGLAEHGIIGALACLFSFHFCGIEANRLHKAA